MSSPIALRGFNEDQYRQFVLLIAFFAEPTLGLAGRGWRSYFGLIGLFAGVMTHLVATVGLSSVADRPAKHLRTPGV